MIGYYYFVAILAFLSFTYCIFMLKGKANFYEAAIFLITFLANIGYLGLAVSRNVEEALIFNKITYLGVCIISLLMVVVIMKYCNIHTPKYVAYIAYLFEAVVFFFAMSAGYTDWYYKSVSIRQVNGVTMMIKEYGWAHILFYIYLTFFSLFSISMLIYTLSKNNKVSTKNVSVLVATQVITIIVFVISRGIDDGLDLTPLGYDLVCLCLLYLIRKNNIYNIENSIVDSFYKQNTYGYIMFDDKKNYLGASSAVMEFMPQLANQAVDTQLATWNNPMFAEIMKWIDEFRGPKQVHLFRNGGNDYKCIIQNMYHDAKKCGYIIEIEDDTKQQEYVRNVNRLAQKRTAFLANISHEIRTPLNSVLGMNEMIIRESHETPIIDYAKQAGEAGSTLVGLVNQIIDFTRIESGKMEVNRTEYALSSILEYITEMMQLLTVEKKLMFTMHVGENVPDILWGDDVKIRQILVNLLTNAVKYTEKGYIELSIESSIAKDSIEKGRMTRLLFHVKDSGIGIKPDEMGDVFTPYAKALDNRNAGLDGAGLGLSLSKQYAELMGGELSVESVYGEGSVFTLALDQQIMGTPKLKAVEIKKEQRHVKYEASFKASTANILVVDDNKTNLAVAKGLLKKTKVNITTANSGVECLELLAVNNYDLVLLDHLMPELDGIETLEQIRDKHLADGVPVVALTANVEDGAKEMFLEKGFAAYLDKPINYKKLEDTIKHLLPASKIENKYAD